MNIHEYLKVEENEKPLDNIVTDGGYCGIFRTVVCVGDSLSSGEFETSKADGTKGYHDFYDYSWGQYMARDCGFKAYNFSKGGMTAKEYMESFADANGFFSNDKLGQAYIIALGVNDLFGRKMELGSVKDIDLDDYTKNADTFAGWYGRIIQRYKALQPRAKFFLVSIPRHGDEKDEKRAELRKLLEDMCKLFDRTYLIDLYTYAPVYDEAFRNKYFLGHMTATGYRLTAKMFESYIDYIIRHNFEDFAQVGFIGTDLYYKPEE